MSIVDISSYVLALHMFEFSLIRSEYSEAHVHVPFRNLRRLTFVLCLRFVLIDVKHLQPCLTLLRPVYRLELVSGIITAWAVRAVRFQQARRVQLGCSMSQRVSMNIHNIQRDEMKSSSILIRLIRTQPSNLAQCVVIQRRLHNHFFFRHLDRMLQ